MIRTARDMQCVRVLLLAVGITAALSLTLAARNTWSYSLTNVASSNTLSLVGEFDVSSKGDTNGLTVLIRNPTNSLLTILWDESAMVLPGGVSERIIHTGVRIINKAAPQAPTTIAPHSIAHEEIIWPASLVTPGNNARGSSIRLSNNCTISLYLTIQHPSGKKVENWTWTFTGVPRKPINWWLWIGIFLVLSVIGQLAYPE